MSPSLSALLACFFCGSLALEASEEALSGPYSGAQVLKVLQDPEGLVDRLIKQEHLDVWSGNGSHVDVLVPAQLVAPLRRSLQLNGINFRTMISDVQAAIAEENPQTPGRRSQNGKINFQQYNRLDAIHGYLDSLGRSYSKFVTVGVMGKSAEGRNLKYVKISSGKPNAKAVFIDGGIHAREWVSPASVVYIISQLVENRSKLPKELLDLDFYVLPVINPDGYEYTHTKDRMWRKNRSKESKCSGTDINRNFAANWGGKGTSGDSCDETYRGRAAASEPETQALVKFLTSIRSNLKAYITFHSYGQYILIPYGHDTNALAEGFNEMKRVGDEAARAIQKLTGQRFTVGNTANTLYPAAGGSDDWTKATLKVPYAYCIELRDQGNYGFVLPAKFILPSAQEAFEAVKVISAAAAKA